MSMPTILTRTLETTTTRSRRRPIGLGIIAVAVLLIASLSYFTVAQYERAVVARFGRLSYVAEPGLHFKMPFIDSVRIYRVDIQQFTTGKLNTYTVDNQKVDTTLTFQWQMPIDQVAYIFTNTPAPEQQLQ